MDFDSDTLLEHAVISQLAWTVEACIWKILPSQMRVVWVFCTTSAYHHCDRSENGVEGA
jgi:hypothetical protein